MLSGQLKKIEHVFIWHPKLRLCMMFRRQGLIEIGLARQLFFVALVADLMNEYVLRPLELASHAHEECAFERILATFEHDQIVTPANFPHQ